MNGPQRFKTTLRFGKTDRVPFLEEGIRQEVIEAWREEGLPPGADLHSLFGLDPRLEIEPELDPLPYETPWPSSLADLATFRQHLKVDDPRRLPAGWAELVHSPHEHTDIRILRVHHGFFLSLGVDEWPRFSQVMYMVKDDPVFVRALLDLQGEFAAEVADNFLEQVEVDAALFSEPIGGNHGPLVSPQLYREMVLPSMKPVFQVLKRRHVEHVIMRTYANPRPLLEDMLHAGVNCLWAVECPAAEMDYRLLRQEFGRDLALIGGLDVRVLRRGKDAIRQEVGEKLPQLMETGGYMPLMNGRVRTGIPFGDYCYYRELLENTIIPFSFPDD
jgi:hypothetical protein